MLSIALSGCNENSTQVKFINKFIGLWEGISYYENVTMNVTFEFFKDNTAKQVSEGFHTHWFTFEVDNISLYLTLQEFPGTNPIIYNYKFSNNDTSLALTSKDIDTIILTKQ